MNNRYTNHARKKGRLKMENHQQKLSNKEVKSEQKLGQRKTKVRENEKGRGAERDSAAVCREH